MWLKQSTASQEISLGQFLDNTDGDTEENGLTIANTDIKLRKGGTTTLANKNSGGATNISNGVYHATLDATDTNTLGLLEIYVHVAGALAVKSCYMVLPAASYDALVTNGLNDVAATDIVSAGAITTSSGAVSNVTTCATTTTNTDMRGTDSALLASSAPSNWSSMVITAGGAVDALTQGYLDTLLTEATVGRIAGNFDTFFENADAATTQVVDDVGGGAGGGTDWTASERNEIRDRLGITGTTAAGGNTPTLSTQASVDDIPTVAEFNARTIPSADYFDPAADTVANVTTVATTTTNTDMRGTDSAATAAALATVDANVDAILVDTSTTIPAQITALNDLSAAQVNAEMLDVLTTDTFAEVSYPGSTASLADMIHYTFSYSSNKITQTSSSRVLRNTGDTGALGTASISDDNITFIKGKDS